MKTRGKSSEPVAVATPAGTNCRSATMTVQGAGRHPHKSAGAVPVGPEKLLATVDDQQRAAALCVFVDPRDASSRVVAGRWVKIGDMYVVYPDDGFDSLVNDVQKRGALFCSFFSVCARA